MTDTTPYLDPPAGVLRNALNGDNIAVEQLLQIFDPYITKICTIRVKDSNNKLIGRYVNEDWKQIASIAFIRSIRGFAKVLKP